MAVNTSNQLDNMVLDHAEPFDWKGTVPFEFGYIAGQRVKLLIYRAERQSNGFWKKWKRIIFPLLKK